MSTGDRPQTGKEKKSHKIEHWQLIMIYMIIYDAASAILAHGAALWLRFDCSYASIPAEYLSRFFYFIPAYAVLTALVFGYFRLYRSVWRFAGYDELARTIQAAIVLFILHIAVIFPLVQ